MEYSKPLPKINGDTQPFWEACRKRELRFQQCLDCGEFRHPPAFLCPRCLSSRVEWRLSEGRGAVFSYAVYHVSFHPGFAQDVPYASVVVELDEGPLMLSRITHCDLQDLRCGMRVALCWEEATPEFTLPLFQPDPES